jgi:hypothetical protein
MVGTIFVYNCPKNDAHDLKKMVWKDSSRVSVQFVIKSLYHWTNVLDFMAPPNLVNFPKLGKMTIAKATFAPSNPFTIHFECMESGPNASTRVR